MSATKTYDQKLELGIEIVSAMKATLSSDFDIEVGRIDALMETEVDNFCSFYEIDFAKQNDEQKSRIEAICKKQKDRLHKQALFVAEIALAKIEALSIKTT